MSDWLFEDRAFEIALNDPAVKKALEGRSYHKLGRPEAVELASGPCSPTEEHRCVILWIESSPDLVVAIVDLTNEVLVSWKWEYETDG